MKNLTPILISIAAVLMLQACGGSSKSTQPTVTPPVVVTPTTPEAVHNIQPEDIAEYIETFKVQQADLELQVDGVKYEIELVDILMSDNVILTRYEKGYVLFGFNFETYEAEDFFRIIDSSLPTFDEAQESPDRVLEGTAITIAEEGDNMVFTGSAKDTATQGMFNIRLVFNESLVSGGTSVIEVVNDTATVNGDLGTKTYIQMSEMINDHPEVKTLVLQQINGSVNDAINLHTGRLVRDAQLTTLVEATSGIYSGGVDLYASGAKRVYTDGAQVGVHSWCCVEGVTADKLGKEHSAHGPQLTFVREMLGADLGPEFYFFTLEASPFDSVHVMTKEELTKYLITP